MHHAQDITCDQIRAARAYLGWSQDRLADAAGVVRKTVYEMESGSQVRASNLAAVRRALEAGGIIFVEDNGKSGILGPPARS